MGHEKTLKRETRAHQRTTKVPGHAGAMSPDVMPPSCLTGHQPWEAVGPVVRELPRCRRPPRLRRTLTMSFALEMPVFVTGLCSCKIAVSLHSLSTVSFSSGLSSDSLGKSSALDAEVAAVESAETGLLWGLLRREPRAPRARPWGSLSGLSSASRSGGILSIIEVGSEFLRWGSW